MTPGPTDQAREKLKLQQEVDRLRTKSNFFFQQWQAERAINFTLTKRIEKLTNEIEEANEDGG